MQLIALSIKVGAAIVWIAFFLSSFAVFPVPYNGYIFWFGVIVFFVHLIEYLVLKATVAPEIFSRFSFWKVMAFGYGHWLPLIK